VGKKKGKREKSCTDEKKEKTRLRGIPHNAPGRGLSVRGAKGIQ